MEVFADWNWRKVRNIHFLLWRMDEDLPQRSNMMQRSFRIGV
jgi:hypothetical protein